MMIKIKHEFTDTIPSNLSDGTLYVSIKYGTAVHKCFCGCGNKVVTPLTPTDWKITYDGESVSLYPSVGNWNLPCKSHYWIENDELSWSDQWTEEEVAQARNKDHHVKRKYYSQDKNKNRKPEQANKSSTKKQSIIEKFKTYFK